MASSLLLLLDDIATVLDDVALMSKTAAKKTAGVLGDDLALNAQQVSGVRADRELPVVWRVAKGSFVNKLILVPLALLISVIAPWLINPLLMIGGLFLCYEGAEKVLHYLHKPKATEQKTVQQILDTEQDIHRFETEKIKGAIRTDFILSAEIIVISLGTVATEPMVTKIGVLCVIAMVMTVGVYGLVAFIVKIDDIGLFLTQKTSALQQKFGHALLAFAPMLMKTLTVVGTVAMFLVGGGIITHAVPLLHHWSVDAVDHVTLIPTLGHIIGALTPTLLNLLIGIVAGLLVLAVVTGIQKIRHAGKSDQANE